MLSATCIVLILSFKNNGGEGGAAFLHPFGRSPAAKAYEAFIVFAIIIASSIIITLRVVNDIN